MAAASERLLFRVRLSERVLTRGSRVEIGTVEISEESPAPPAPGVEDAANGGAAVGEIASHSSAESLKTDRGKAEVCAPTTKTTEQHVRRDVREEALTGRAAGVIVCRGRGPEDTRATEGRAGETT